jgi:hypothetical protein
MAKQERYFIGPSLLGDIREVITRVDAIASKTSGPAQPVRILDINNQAQFRLRRGTFTGTWNIGATAAVAIVGSTQTVAVTNYCTPVKGQTNATQTLNVVYGSVMGTMTAVEIQQPTCTLSLGGLDLTELPNFDASAIQLLGHAASDTDSTACFGLQWFSVTQCSTAT